VSSSVIFSWLSLSLSLSLSLQGLLVATGGFSIRFPEIARLGTEEVVSKGVSGNFFSFLAIFGTMSASFDFFFGILLPCFPLSQASQREFGVAGGSLLSYKLWRSLKTYVCMFFCFVTCFCKKNSCLYSSVVVFLISSGFSASSPEL
jgi:hypothetical protein